MLYATAVNKRQGISSRNAARHERRLRGGGKYAKIIASIPAKFGRTISKFLACHQR